MTTQPTIQPPTAARLLDDFPPEARVTLAANTTFTQGRCNYKHFKAEGWTFNESARLWTLTLAPDELPALVDYHFGAGRDFAVLGRPEVNATFIAVRPQSWALQHLKADGFYYRGAWDAWYKTVFWPFADVLAGIDPRRYELRKSDQVWLPDVKGAAS